MHLIFFPEKETESDRRVLSPIEHRIQQQGRDTVFSGSDSKYLSRAGAPEYPVRLNLLTQLAGTWNINSVCIPSEWGSGVVKGEVCLTERLMYAP